MYMATDHPSSVPSFSRLMWPTLKALEQLGGSAGVQEILDRVTSFCGFTDAQQSLSHGNGPQTELSYRLAWARTYLKTVGAVENLNPGVWAVTGYGRGLREGDMPSIPTRVRAMHGRNRRSGQESPSAVEPSDGRLDLVEEAVTDWEAQLLTLLQDLSPDRFERLCQRVLRESGFVEVQVTGRSGDGGIDGIGILRASLLSSRVFFQCKRYRGSVGPSAVRDFRGAMIGRSDKGIPGSFTAQAIQESTRDGAPVIDLVDGDQLCQLLKSFKLGVATRQVEAVDIDRAWFERI